MLGFTLEIMGRISEEDKKMSGSWICFLLVMCKWFEGPVTLPLSLPNMFVVPWKWLMGSVSNKFARAPKFCFRTDWGREYPRARTVTYLVVFWNQWVPIPLLSKNGILHRNGRGLCHVSLRKSELHHLQDVEHHLQALLTALIVCYKLFAERLCFPDGVPVEWWTA